jgi:hypothetical protein
MNSSKQFLSQKQVSISVVISKVSKTIVKPQVVVNTISL